MKKRWIGFLVAIMVVLSCVFTGCDYENILVETAALYCEGAEMDWAYGNQRKEFNVGKNCYMKIKIKAVTNSYKTVKCQMKVPKIKFVDAYYFDGIKQSITPEVDEISKVTIYNFEICANKANKAKEYEIVIQYVPNEAGKATVTLEYDEKVEPSYDYQSTILFVKGE